MIEEIPIATCLDRARIALEQTGQIHCAMQMGELQKLITGVAYLMEYDPNDPIRILQDLIDCWIDADWYYVE